MARVVIVDQLRKSESAGHARRPTADNDDVGWHFRVLDVGERLAEDQGHGLMAERCTINGNTPCNLLASARSAVTKSHLCSMASAQ
jgi:hypothetical protein